MNGLVDCSLVRYAVIEALRTEADPERLVIAYRNKQALHDLIATPCIIAFGFSSRKEAVACTEACVSAAAA
jgi:thymidylate synthase